MRNTAPLVYPSAVDRWLLVLLLAPIFMAIAFAAYLLNEGRADEAGTMILMAAAIAAVTGVFTIPCRLHLVGRCSIDSLWADLLPSRLRRYHRSDSVVDLDQRSGDVTEKGDCSHRQTRSHPFTRRTRTLHRGIDGPSCPIDGST